MAEQENIQPDMEVAAREAFSALPSEDKAYPNFQVKVIHEELKKLKERYGVTSVAEALDLSDEGGLPYDELKQIRERVYNALSFIDTVGPMRPLEAMQPVATLDHKINHKSVTGELIPPDLQSVELVDFIVLPNGDILSIDIEGDIFTWSKTGNFENLSCLGGKVPRMGKLQVTVEGNVIVPLRQMTESNVWKDVGCIFDVNKKLFTGVVESDLYFVHPEGYIVANSSTTDVVVACDMITGDEIDVLIDRDDLLEIVGVLPSGLIVLEYSEQDPEDASPLPLYGFFNPKTKVLEYSTPRPYGSRGFFLHGNDEIIVTTNADHNLAFHDTKTGEEIGTIENQYPISMHDSFPDGKVLVTAANRCYSASNSDVTETFFDNSHYRFPSKLKASHTGSLIALQSNDTIGIYR